MAYIGLEPKSSHTNKSTLNHLS